MLWVIKNPKRVDWSRSRHRATTSVSRSALQQINTTCKFFPSLASFRCSTAFSFHNHGFPETSVPSSTMIQHSQSDLLSLDFPIFCQLYNNTRQDKVARDRTNQYESRQKETSRAGKHSNAIQRSSGQDSKMYVQDQKQRQGYRCSTE